MRLQQRAAANRLEGGDVLLYASVVYYGGLQSVKATLRCVVDSEKTRVAHAYPYITKHIVSVAYVPESEA